MTERYHSLTVVLKKDMREDDAKSLIDAIRQLRGVLEVSGVVADISLSAVAEARIRHELGQKLIDVLYPPKG